MKSKSGTKVTANALTQMALKTLPLCGFVVWRQNNGGVYDPTKKVFRRNSSTPGISDILCYQKKTVKIIAIEIKVGRDKVSWQQTEFLKGINDNGGIAHVVRTPEELENIIEHYKLT